MRYLLADAKKHFAAVIEIGSTAEDFKEQLLMKAQILARVVIKTNMEDQDILR